MQTQMQLGSFIDSIVGSATASAVSAGTAAAQPLITEVMQDLETVLLPIALFTAGSFLISLLTYREVKRLRRGSAKPAGTAGRR